MREMIRYGLILAIICLIAAGLLAGVNLLTKVKIVSQAQAEEISSLKEVMPEGNDFEAVKSGNDILYYKVYDLNKSFVGVAFKASGKGYSSIIETMVGMRKDGTITAIKVVAQNETPGLGSRVAEPDFLKQFIGKNLYSQVEDEGGKKGFTIGVDAITGATISSSAVVYSIQNKAKEIQGLIVDEQ